MNSLVDFILILAIVIFYEVLLKKYIHECNNINSFMWSWCNLILICLVVITFFFLKKFNETFFGNYFLKKVPQDILVKTIVLTKISEVVPSYLN